jgi:hypothetical protein
MAKFTVQVEYLLPVYKHVQVDAKNIKEACEKALETDWSNEEHDFDTSTREYVTGIVRGHHPDIYVPGVRGCRIPPECKFSKKDVMR